MSIQERGEQFDRAADTLTDAFYTDPVTVFILSDPQARTRWLRIGMKAFMEICRRQGSVTTVGGSMKPDGVLTVVRPGGYPISTLLFLRCLFSVLRLKDLLQASPKVLWMYLKMMLLFDRKHLRGPHWYVAAIGVLPSEQGKGLSRKLLQPIMDQADREGLPLYLENSNERNLPIYGKLGFKVLEEILPFAGGPRVWLMLRPPRA